MADSNQSQLSPQSTDPAQQLQADAASGAEEKTRKRDFFRFGRDKEDKKKTKGAGEGAAQSSSLGGLRPVSPLAGLDNTKSPGSPPRNSPYGIAASPRGMRSASPRTHSPASSMIFERSVQEDVAIPQASPQIPSHIITENHIPPALDATSEAITDKRLDPDTVEIVTHSAHQPAAVTITEGHTEQPASPVLSDEHIASHIPRSQPDLQPWSETASNYANLDSVDVRRLSFISFADVVHGEHDLTQDQRRDSAGLTSSGVPIARSPSPLRSPVSSSAAMGTSPPTSLETSPHRQSNIGDLNIETMRQALRKTGSGDLSGVRSQPMSAVGNDDGLAERSFR